RQQLYTQHGMVQSPGGVEPRRELECNRLRRTVPHKRHLLQGPDTASRAARDECKTLTNKPPVLILQRHYVGDGGERHQIEERLKGQAGSTMPELIGLHSLVSQPGGTQSAEWIT